MLAPRWGTGTKGGFPPGVKPVSVLVFLQMGVHERGYSDLGYVSPDTQNVTPV